MNGNVSVVIEQVRRERERQDRKWGEQNHEPFMWLAILHEETGEAACAALECDGEAYARELIQVAAVAIAAAQCYLRLGKPLTRSSPEKT